MVDVWRVGSDIQRLNDYIWLGVDICMVDLWMGDLTTSTLQNCEAVPRRARVESSWTFVSINPRLESDKE